MICADCTKKISVQELKLYWLATQNNNYLLLKDQGLSLKVPPCPIFGKKERGGYSQQKQFIQDFLNKKLFRRFAPVREPLVKDTDAFFLSRFGQRGNICPKSWEKKRILFKVRFFLLSIFCVSLFCFFFISSPFQSNAANEYKFCFLNCFWFWGRKKHWLFSSVNLFCACEQ